jgi:cell division inhibitor SepF
MEDAVSGAMRKMGVYLGLVEEDDGYADADTYDRVSARGDYASESRPARAADLVRQGPRDWPAEHDGATHHQDGVYSPEYGEPERASYRITTLHPRTYNEARTIGEHFRAGTPVIMNLSDMDDADAKRLVDFAAGLTFGLHGRIERVTAKVFLLSPHDVTVTAQDKARIAEGGFFNQS